MSSPAVRACPRGNPGGPTPARVAPKLSEHGGLSRAAVPHAQVVRAAHPRAGASSASGSWRVPLPPAMGVKPMSPPLWPMGRACAITWPSSCLAGAKRWSASTKRVPWLCRWPMGPRLSCPASLLDQAVLEGTVPQEVSLICQPREALCGFHLEGGRDDRVRRGSFPAQVCRAAVLATQQRRKPALRVPPGLADFRGSRL